MGLKIEAPQARFSQDTMPQYNVEQGMRMDIVQPEDDKLFPKHPPDSRAWMPLPEIDSKEGDGKEGDGTDPLDQWEAVKKAWGKPEAQPGPTVALCTQVFGWSRSLPTKKPKLLIDNIGRLCLKAPLLGVVSS